MPQSGEPAEPPEGQDEPSAGPIPRQHQEAPKLTGPGKGISGVRTSVWFVGYIQTLPLINLHVCVNVPLSRQDLGYKSLSPQQSADVLTNITYISLIYNCSIYYIHTALIFVWLVKSNIQIYSCHIHKVI